ncbi:MAG TPA: hypothetical protein VLL76_12290 [Candidatus Omnitrophota bacterium]|nr:hypothetical protein [Candidatus Omnitrophota bacterium]
MTEKILAKHVGHVSVVIEKPDGTIEGPIGFGPVNVGAKKDAVFGGPGTVRDDSGYANSGNGRYPPNPLP